jgi:hypothetical protein
MSPTPPPIEPSPLWLDAAVSGGLGILAGLVRWLMATEPQGLGTITRHLLVAGITASFAGLAVQDLIDSEGLRFAAAGSTGYAGVALWDLAAQKLKALVDRWMS